MIQKKFIILIVDDEEVIRDACALALEKGEIKVISASDYDSGLALFKSSSPDIALIDLKMPGKGGMELLKEMESIDHNVVKIVITGYATIPLAVDAIKVGAYDFIPKPFTPDEIRRAVSRGLAQRKMMLQVEQLEEERNRIRQNLISLVSHELRSPIAASIQYLEVILSGVAGEISPKIKPMIEKSNSRLREMLELIGKWLTISTFDPNQAEKYFTHVDMESVICESMEVIKLSCDDFDFIYETDGSKPCIRGSRVLLLEVFNNLIGNALKHGFQGGWVKAVLESGGNNIRVMVMDNGPGIAPEHRERIFDEFYRVDGRRNAPVKGSGLGLSIVKRMVDLHGGGVELDEESKGGAVFIVTLPLDRK